MSDEQNPPSTPQVPVGLAGEQQVTVTEDMAPPHLPAKVLSTPSMIQLIEMTCLQTVQPHIGTGQTTVGTHVNVSHTGPAMAGEEVTIRVSVQETEKKRITFGTEVLSPRGSISTGTHQRAIVDLSRFG